MMEPMITGDKTSAVSNRRFLPVHACQEVHTFHDRMYNVLRLLWSNKAMSMLQCLSTQGDHI